MSSGNRLSPLVPVPREGYRRTFEARIDDHSENGIFVLGTLQDGRYCIEHSWVLHLPEYEIEESSARHLAGDPGVVSPDLILRYPEIRGARIARGFSKRVAAALGDLPGCREHLFLAIEMARTGQQVYKFPPGLEADYAELAASLPPGPSKEARLEWEKDRDYIPALINSCLAYNDDSRRLFAERRITHTFDCSLTARKPCRRNVFTREKELTIVRCQEGGFECRNRMKDNVHDIRIEFGLASDGVVRSAGSQALNLPYSGLCNDAQDRMPLLAGRRITRDYTQILAETVGGACGCTHLFDLSADCLRLFEIG